ncbi:isoprenylcysteine carboxylmethyltransferase family protein [Flagellimonas aquimarina]|uniref:Isoprenylcysteine carboxylmethyltransferase family protein n=1 Tax=Flagellimonas aquimarina TaxID=2201895 RepID=A0A316L2X7_9FLAO|nr:isoprenylcysteine carboxylmethyltransferase family protein [Allomuricauda koreensis]PWL38583.1 isoprenylcysteine carboxylmethyltransferase family protein [Allomuricauda koreensis]
MKLRIPPPLVMLIFACFMYVLNRFLPFGSFDFFGRIALATFLVVLAFIIMAWAIFQFLRAKTTTNPINLTKTSNLVTTGIFKYTRNPMYLGMLLILLAFGLKLGNAFNTLVAAGFVYFMNYFQIENEEKALTKLFDKKYIVYCKATRRWF